MHTSRSMNNSCRLIVLLFLFSYSLLMSMSHVFSFFAITLCFGLVEQFFMSDVIHLFHPTFFFSKHRISLFLFHQQGVCMYLCARVCMYEYQSFLFFCFFFLSLVIYYIRIIEKKKKIKRMIN